MPPHDLALQAPATVGGEVIAVVRSGKYFVPNDSSGKIWVLHNVTSTQLQNPVGFDSDATPYVYGMGLSNRVSDSIETLFVRVGDQTRRFLVTIGGVRMTSAAADAEVKIVSIDSLPTYEQAHGASGVGGNGTTPYDLTVTPNGNRAFIRCWAPPDEPLGQPGRDVLVIRFDHIPFPITEAWEAIGGSGGVDDANMADLIQVKGNRVMSITSDGLGGGYVHTTTNP